VLIITFILSSSAPAPAPSATSPRAGLARLSSLTGSARAALALVWQTDRRLTVCLVALTLGAGGLPAGIAYVGKLIIDGVLRAVAVPSPSQRHTVLLFLGLELALIATLVALQRGLAVCDALLRVRLAQRVIELVLGKALQLRLADFENATLYDQLRQVREQATERPLSLVRRALTALQLGVSLLGFLALLAAFSPWIMALLLAAGLPAVLVEARFNTDAFRLYRAHSPEARRQAYLETVLTREDHAKEVMLLGLGPLLLKRHRRIFDHWYRADRALTVRRGAWGFALALLAVAALGGSYAWVVLQAMLGAISVGALAMLFAVLRQAQNATTELLLVAAGMYDDNLYITALHELLAFPTEQPADAAESGPLPGDGLRFEGVEFVYPGAKEPALSGLDFHLAAGTKVGIAGRNGAGKSTFAKLALGLYVPTRGRVLLDGRDLRNWQREALSRRFSALFQDFVRYQFQASDNVGFGDLEHLDDDASVTRAAQRALVHELIQALPRGYQTQLGHWFGGGHELSLGEWQKIALARVFMREQADILVLDEPSASLDAQAESDVFAKFLEFSRARSAILISHRLSTLRSADTILMFEHGRCVERGHHDQLLASAGAYAQLFLKQAAGYD
jgi:ATP-binding cassette, subfamily B, bacterial